MSQFGDDCVICGATTLHLLGWDNGVIRGECVAAPWTGRPGAVFSGMAHFSCVRDWEHREAFFDALTAAYSDRDGTVDVEQPDGTVKTARRGMPDRYETVYSWDNGLILRETAVKQWQVIDRAWGWANIRPKAATQIASGPTPLVWERQGPVVFFNAPLPQRAPDWTLPQLLADMGLESRYPGLATMPSAELTGIDATPGREDADLDITAPVPLPEPVVEYFRKLLADEGPSAFAAYAYPDE
jgi:hypothetical protein